jgi:hypothetical protein
MRALVRLGILLSFAAPLAAYANTWQLTREAGSWSETVKATYEDKDGNNLTAICKNDFFETQLTVATLRIPGIYDVTYRIDNGPEVKTKWSRFLEPFIRAVPDVDVARELLNGRKIVIDLTGLGNRPAHIEIPLTGARAAIIAALKACNLGPEGLETQVRGLRREIVRDLERWGPKYTHLAKEVLATAGAYKGPLDTPVDADFALAAQAFHDKYLADCSEGRIEGNYHCKARRKATVEDKTFDNPGLGSIIYDAAEGELRQKIGNTAPRQ